MPSVFQSRQDEPKPIEAAAARSSEGQRSAGALHSNRSLAFKMTDSSSSGGSGRASTRSGGVIGVGMSENSILASSQLSRSGASIPQGRVVEHDDDDDDDQAPPVLQESNEASRPLRTSYFTRLASQLLGRASTSSNSSAGSYASVPDFGASSQITMPSPNPMNASVASPEFDKISVDSAFVPHAQPVSVMNDSVGPSISSRGNPQTRREPLRTRLSSGMSSVQREMEHASPVSEATYMKMRKTLDPEELMNGYPRSTNSVVLSSLRPVRDPFSLEREPPVEQRFTQRGRAATTGTAPNFLLANNRANRSWTAVSHAPAASTGSSAAVEEQPPSVVRHVNDPRGTFRTTTADTAQQIFAAQQVRLQNRWLTDVWIYMKNSHPFLGICTAHKWHPYKRHDRALVLLVSLVLAIFLTGLYATQECCSKSLDTSVAVVSKSRYLIETRRRLASDISFNCAAFGGHCNNTTTLCTLGSSCSALGRCEPVDSKALAAKCSTNNACPLGWRCALSTGTCHPATSLVCYLPHAHTTSRTVSFAAEDVENTEGMPSEVSPSASGASSSGSGGSAPVDAISAIAALLKYAKDNNVTTVGSSGSDLVSTVPSQSPSPSLSITPTPSPSKTPIPTSSQVPALSTDNSSASDSTGSSSSLVYDIQKLLITLTEPISGGVYGVSSTIPVAWHVKILVGERSFLDSLTFRVDFSRDGATFDTILASNIKSDKAVDAESVASYHYDWDLAMNESLTCDQCVIRVCTQQSDTLDSLCIRTDGDTSASVASRSDGGPFTAASASSQPKITFHIVKEILSCACGISHAPSFVAYAYLIALALPVSLLLCEQLVTFYQDSKLFGMFARRGGPQMPVMGYYAAKATTRGRVVLGVALIGLVLSVGTLLARVNSTNFFDSVDAVIGLWVGLFFLVLLIGFIYSSVVYCVLFTWRWYQDERRLRSQLDDQRQRGDFATMLDNVNRSAPAPGLSYEWPSGSNPTVSSRSAHAAVAMALQSTDGPAISSV